MFLWIIINRCMMFLPVGMRPLSYAMRSLCTHIILVCGWYQSLVSDWRKRRRRSFYHLCIGEILWAECRFFDSMINIERMNRRGAFFHWIVSFKSHNVNGWMKSKLFVPSMGSILRSTVRRFRRLFPRCRILRTITSTWQTMHLSLKSCVANILYVLVPGNH